MNDSHVSRKIVVHGDDIYIVTGSPLTGYYTELVTQTDMIGKFQRSWQAMRAAAEHAGVKGGDAA